MLRWVLAAYGLWATCCTAERTPDLPPTSVHALTYKSFASFVKQHDTVMVNFGSPYSPHCKQLAPEYERAAQFLQNHGVRLATVNCINEWDLCADVRQYPTMRVFRGSPDTFTTYFGGRDADDIISYMTDGAYPTSSRDRVVSTTTKAREQPTKAPQPNPAPNATASTSVFLAQDNSYAVVKLEIPGLPYEVPGSNEALSFSSSVLLKFNISENGHHLMVNGELIALLVPNPSTPARLTVAHVLPDWDINDLGMTKSPESELPPDHGLRKVGVDYELDARNRDDPNIRYYNYHPTITLNVIGATTAGSSYNSDFILDSMDQKIIDISLRGRDGTIGSHDPRRVFAIAEIRLRDRQKNLMGGQQVYQVPRPDDHVCSLWSWRCPDIPDAPWYRYVWRRNFDEFGRIGCLRRALLRGWTSARRQTPLNFLLRPQYLGVPPLVILCCYALVRYVRLRRRQVEVVTQPKVSLNTD